MKSPFTDKEMELVESLKSPKCDKYYRCKDTGALFLSKHITKQELLDSQTIKQEILDRIKS